MCEMGQEHLTPQDTLDVCGSCVVGTRWEGVTGVTEQTTHSGSGYLVLCKNQDWSFQPKRLFHTLTRLLTHLD